MRRIRILFAEDDLNLSTVVKDFLGMAGYDVFHARDGQQAIDAYAEGAFHLLILDVMLPKMDGFTLAEKIREIDQDVPLIFLTARALEHDRIRGFKLGADDYIVKPFSIDELGLRIEALMKRCFPVIDSNEVFEIGDFRFDYPNLCLHYGSETRQLTRKEGDLLKVLVENRNKLLLRETALKAVWGSDDYFLGRSMDVFIARLRKYLKPDSRVNISNIHGTGFRLDAP
jgi:DNA-binding response OmpR family regulator